ncbi:hypothetical protein [Streptomyces sp. NPDC050988]|uniref:hypothetical protein n=1 Tax=Streptomyces sp. NPDC050988 TaxID=3365637 RepID=UPI0037898103
MLATALVYGGSLAALQPGGNVGAPQNTEAGHTAPDAGAEDREARAAETGDFFDGRGGIAGVEFTAAQRNAIIREALSRGLTLKEARELAYGEEEGKDNALTYVVADGEMYRQVAPAEEASYGEASSEGGKADAPAAGSGKASSDKGSKKKGNGPAAKEDKEDGKATGKAEETDKGLVDVLGDTVKDVVPDPIEDVVESLPDELSPFRTFMADISQPGTEPEYTVVPLDVNDDEVVEALQVTATAQVSASMTVTAEVVAPVEESPEAPLCTVVVTLTDSATDEVISAPEPVVVDNPQDVSQAAIGAIVDTVVDAAQGEPSATAEIPIEAVSTVTEAQDEAEEVAPVGEPEPSEPETVDSLGAAAREEEVERSLAQVG